MIHGRICPVPWRRFFQASPHRRAPKSSELIAFRVHRFGTDRIWQALGLLAVTLMFCEQPPLSGAPQVEAASIQQPDRQEEEPQVISSNDAMVLTAAAFRQAAERIRPSLVTIESFGGVSAVQGRIGGIRKQGEGNTTGVLISAEGHIVTSTFNFIQLPPVITVITADGERRVASLLGRDEIRKICLLKVEPFSGIQVPELVELDDIRIGQWAISVGVGYGDLNPAISTGIISATNRIGGRAIQTDANISPANYGGPLLDIEGRMIGICVPMNPQSQAVGAGVEWYDSGIGFAVPLAGADKLLARLKNGERIYPAFLGVLATTDPGANGVRIQQIVPDSAAAGLQLKAGDLIREIDGLPVNDLAEMKRVLNRLEAGDEISIVVVSQDDDASKEMQVVLGPPPAPANDDAPFEPPKIR